MDGIVAAVDTVAALPLQQLPDCDAVRQVVARVTGRVEPQDVEIAAFGSAL